MGIFTIGTMLWYIMDAMQLREGAFTVVGGAEVAGALNLYCRQPALISLTVLQRSRCASKHELMLTLCSCCLPLQSCLSNTDRLALLPTCRGGELCCLRKAAL